jgi:outer membrane protein insertion porin family
LRLAEFRVAKPDVRIRSVAVTGGTPQFSAATDKLIRALAGRNYNEGLIPASLSNLLLAAYKNAGYQACSISTLTRTPAASANARVDVDVAATIVPGDVYRLSHLDWPGSLMMSSEAFAAEATLHPGDIASRSALLDSLGKLEAAYRNKGYMDVVVTATPQLDAASRQVAFMVAAIPGEQYKLRRITPENLSAAQQADFDKAWKMHPGDIFDESYASSFLKNNSALQSFNGYSAKFKTIADPDAHTVDLIMSFIKGGA